MTTTVPNSVLADQPIASPPIRYIGVPKEVHADEQRVAATPATIKKLQQLGYTVLIETGAGAAADYSDAAYEAIGGQIVPDARSLWSQSEIVIKVRPPEYHPDEDCAETELLREGGTLISFVWPGQNQELLNQFCDRKANVLAMDAIPRISRAQKLDALSSMSNVAGYRAVIEAASHFGRFFTGQVTAAGKIPPAKVLVIGAGVAGLAAIGAARSLGAIVRAFDTRLAVKEQVESLGAEFLELSFEEDGSGEGGYAKTMSPAFIAAEMALFAQQAADVDIIITTALIPGKKAPLLVTGEMVRSMKPGSVVVDLAAEQGGNCEVTKPGKVYQYHGVTIFGLPDLPSRMANQASQLYGTNIVHLLKEMGGAETTVIDLDDEVLRGATVVHQGEVIWPAPPPAMPPTPKVSAPAPAKTIAPEKSPSPIWGWFVIALGGIVLMAIGNYAPSSFLSHLTVLVLACFVGWQAIWKVAPALHTPLMSVTNAISGIIIIGGMLQISGPISSPTTILGAIALLLGTINIAGGFTVTQRMLSMFRK
ncbi:MAG: Re/Si-specific NAD(P)(+) transhydrogenase subunit alpha [Cyanobacteria bacterium P01_H01_bin.15]